MDQFGKMLETKFFFVPKKNKKEQFQNISQDDVKQVSFY